MALEGTLSDFSFADILQLISLQRKTGVLTLKHEEKLVTISFLDGCIAGSSTLHQRNEDRIGLILLKRGELTEAELESALKRQEETLQRLGRILINDGVVSSETVREALEQQILQIVYRVFRWSDGEYHFSQEKDIDFDRDLMVPMAADSVIMEGARMTDEWPFIAQRIPNLQAVFTKTDSSRQFELAEEEDDEFDGLGFSFTDSPEEAPVREIGEDRLTRNQMTVYELVGGKESVEEIILESPLIEFETCKALADLVDRGIVRLARQEEVARQSRRVSAPVATGTRQTPALPWLAIPFVALLVFATTVIPHNRLNPVFHGGTLLWQRYVQESTSWLRLARLSAIAESYFFLEGLYPESVAELVDGGYARMVNDPWGRPYRLATREHRLVVSGTDAFGEPSPLLRLSRRLAWEGDTNRMEQRNTPGVRLLD
jgi:hypothetical protein